MNERPAVRAVHRRKVKGDIMDGKMMYECECAAAALYDGGWRAEDFEEILERELEGIEYEIENRRNEYFDEVSDEEILADLKEEAEEKAKMICKWLKMYEEEKE